MSKWDMLGSEMVTCPYDEAHVVERSRLPFHVTKCDKNVANLKIETRKKVCPLNGTHIVDERDLNEHMKTCPDREQFHNYMYCTDNQEQMLGESVNHPDCAFEAEESWTLNNASYNPAESAKKKPDVLVIPHGAKPSERRAFRQEQRRNYNQKK